MKRYFEIPKDLSVTGKLNFSYQLGMYKMPQFLGWLLILDRDQYDDYYSFVSFCVPLDYEDYLQRLAVYFPIGRLIERGLINPFHKDFYEDIHKEFSFMNFDVNKVDTTFSIDPNKVFKRYVEIGKPMKIWDKRWNLKEEIRYIGLLNEDAIDADYYSTDIENYFF